MNDVQLISGDARRIPLADASVQCIVTSPPYWGLRKYAGEQELVWESSDAFMRAHSICPGTWPHEFSDEQRAGISGGQNQNSKTENGDGATNRPLEPSTHGTCRRCGAWRGAYGLEPTVEMYVQHSIEILRELRRVLRPDGVLFWNLGDSYCSGAFSLRTRETPEVGSDRNLPRNWYADANKIQRNGNGQASGLKPKDLVLMPARIALAAQADGWWVRSMVVWAKPNPMPESVSDRPTDSYEYILMLTRSARYFWDADAVREKAEFGRRDHGGVDQWEHRGNGDVDAKHFTGTVSGGDGGTRNLRNVWDFATQPYAGAHFATFPEELPRRCILAATSAKGACAQCGAPWQRIVDKKPATMNIRVRDAKRGVADADEGYAATATETETASYGREELGESCTIGWSPTCRCRGQHGKTKPCVVLDPFGGSGTTGRVAIELNRRAVLLDLAYGNVTAEDRAKGRDYAALAHRRLSEVQRTLPLL